MVFDFAIGPNTPIVIDPDVATGYVYNIISGPVGAYIGTAEFEFLGDDAYDIIDLQGNLLFDDFEPGLNKIVDFVTAGFVGLTGFKVQGIDPALMLDPTSPVAFKTSLSFAGYSGTGNFSVSQTPQIEFVDVAAVPEPTTWSLTIIGFGLVGAAARRRKSVFSPT